MNEYYLLPVPVEARYTAWVCGRPVCRDVSSNPAEGMDVCLLWVLCVVRYKSLRRADHPVYSSAFKVVFISSLLREFVRASMLERAKCLYTAVGVLQDADTLNISHIWMV